MENPSPEEAQTAFVLKIDTQSAGWHKAMTAVLKSVKGLEYYIYAPEGLAYVKGNIEPAVLLKLLGKVGKLATLYEIGSGYSHSKAQNSANVDDNFNVITYGQYYDPYRNNYYGQEYNLNNVMRGAYGNGYGHDVYHDHRYVNPFYGYNNIDPSLYGNGYGPYGRSHYGNGYYGSRYEYSRDDPYRRSTYNQRYGDYLHDNGPAAIHPYRERPLPSMTYDVYPSEESQICSIM